MKKVLVILLLLTASVAAESVITGVTRGFRDAVRVETNIASTDLLSGPELFTLSHRAILFTSIDVGGVEEQLSITMVADLQYYTLPDTIVEVLGASVTTEDNNVRSLKAWYPQFIDESDVPAGYEGRTGPDELPFGYHYWDNQLQIFPVPTKGDTVVLKCYVEHPTMDTTTDDSLIFLKPAFTEAAIQYACYKACVATGMYDKAAMFLAIYEKMKGDLRQRYTRGFDAQRTQQ